jgi:hypothetical protein
MDNSKNCQIYENDYKPIHILCALYIQSMLSESGRIFQCTLSWGEQKPVNQLLQTESTHQYNEPG